MGIATGSAKCSKKSKEKEAFPAAEDVVERETLRRQTAQRDADVNLGWGSFSSGLEVCVGVRQSNVVF